MIAWEYKPRVAEIVAWKLYVIEFTCPARREKKLSHAGEPMGNLDMMIAAHALAAQAVLVTHDRVFHRIKHLRLEDWTKPH